MFIFVAGFAYYHFVYVPAHHVPLEIAYVLPLTAVVVDTPAEIRLDVEEVRNGDRVEVLSRTRSWAHIRLVDGKSGWIELKDLLDSQTYDRGQQLIREMEASQVQARGHVSGEVNVHLEPSRQSPQLSLLHPNDQVEVFGRQLAERPAENSDSATSPEAGEGASGAATVRDAWYLVRSGSHGGWVLGRFVALNIPTEIESYAQGVNTVAWVVLKTVDDNGRKVPEYLVADRIGMQEFDFNHIRVFTWWIKKQAYATAYAESDVDGYFPIRTTLVGDTPYFRLRMLDDHGRKIQRVYGMFDTIVRPLGFVEGWESDAIPARPVTRSKHRR